ncbi:MAG: LicD family protein [Bacilli bacterium]|nr:LicD family protein [Bacilli bacterium]
MGKKSITLTDKQLKKLHDVELEILKEFDRICRKNKIEYYLIGGSLIGAVRHNGFIPWDDDVDVCLTRDNYDKFIKVQAKELDKKRFFFESIETDKECGMLFSKLKRKDSKYLEVTSSKDDSRAGIWIDVFAFDNIKDDSFFSKLRYFHIYCLKMILLKKYNHLNYMEDKKKNTIIKIISILSVFYNGERLKKRLSKLMRKDNNKDTKMIASYAGTYLFKEIIDKEYLTDPIEHDFESLKVFIPKRYDEILRHYYGDYMKLPPKDKRVCHPVLEIKFPKEKD